MPEPKKSTAVVLASGGMDSCVSIALACRSHDPALLHVMYGQRTEHRELMAFHAVADYYGIDRRLVIEMSHLSQIGGSALTDANIDVPKPGGAEGEIPVTYVPFRNAHLLCCAVSWAEVIGAVAVYIGAVEEDSSGYPDCRESFYQAFQSTVDTGTKTDRQIEIVRPLIDKTKSEIVQIGDGIGAPLGLTWSCYRSETEACGECDSCFLRWRGFLKAGVVDLIPYAKTPI
ncbi:MAG: 7-cyano-7-deazaguanine synthase QueC [Candidatus Latescibacteria bacterium]|nr:7-cyano-7-deazaguanine synthase QueC [Candidatus Latescibacterota bacterium]